MQFMIISKGGASSPRPIEDVARCHQALADQGRLALALGLRPGGPAVRLALWPGGERITHGPFAESGELVAGIAIVDAASKQEAVELLAGPLACWRPGDGDADLAFELRETGCPGGCPQVPPAAEGEGRRYLIMLRSDAATESDRIPPQATLDAQNAFNAAQAGAGVLLAGDGLKSSARGDRIHFKGGRASVIDGPFAEAKELIAGFWMIRAASMPDAIAWARTLPYPTGPEVEVDIREVAGAADAGSALTPEQARADHALRAEQLDAALRARMAAPLPG